MSVTKRPIDVAERNMIQVAGFRWVISVVRRIRNPAVAVASNGVVGRQGKAVGWLWLVGGFAV
jgi:hypothetical protein